MARHRSPRGRRADQPSLPAVPRRAAAGVGAHRSVPNPLRRGSAVVVVTGGAFSLMGATVPLAAPAAGLNALSLDATVVPATQNAPAAAALLQPSVEPVAPAPDVADAAELVKAVQLAEQEIARLAAEQEKAAADRQAAAVRAAEDRKPDRADAAPKGRPAAAADRSDCGIGTKGLGAVKPHVRDAAEFLGCLFGKPNMHGVAGRAGTSDHPSGLAIDFMVDRSTGDRLAECALRNKEALGITYVIWEQRINHGSGWKPMEDRGGVTANHFDHVHISFKARAGGGDLGGC